MARNIGTVARGIRCPIIRKGDDLSKIVTESVIEAAKSDGFELKDRDVVGITESIVARSRGNYASKEAIGKDVRNKLKEGTVGVIFPILSRNRFAVCLRGIAKGADKIILMLSYPADEVGNRLLSDEQLEEKNINPHSATLTLSQFRELFGAPLHPFTGVDYVSYYKTLIEEEGAEAEIIFSNDVFEILNHTNDIIHCDIHTRERTRRLLRAKGANSYGLDEILNSSVDGSGYNSKYGLLGSNKSTEESVKLFPNDCNDLVRDIQKSLLKESGKHIEVMVYGDGAFKDPAGKIWEFADPVVSPAYTDGLMGVPNELKLKYLADNDFKDLKGEALKKAVAEKIKNKDGSLVGKMESEGTTPRKLTDLIGSLCDLVSGSGDKGTPIVLVQGYFDNYISE